MPGKSQLVEVLDVSADVVEAELALLEEWANDPNTTADRRAEIRLTANYIGVGFSSALRRTAQALGQARALPESAVVHPPGDGHRAMVIATVDGVSTRSELDGPNLSDPAFTNAMTMAKTNSDQAAENSETILADCSQAGVAAAAPQLVAAPAALQPLFARFDNVRPARRSSPKRTNKKPKGRGGGGGGK